jgi:hypothetical protein
MRGLPAHNRFTLTVNRNGGTISDSIGQGGKLWAIRASSMSGSKMSIEGPVVASEAFVAESRHNVGPKDAEAVP